jgi:hypothetical protein
LDLLSTCLRYLRLLRILYHLLSTLQLLNVALL